MSNQITIITDEVGNKKSVVMPYAIYEQLINALAAHDESHDKLMKIASAMVELQEVRSESSVAKQQPAATAKATANEDLALTETLPDPRNDIRSYQRARGFFTETGGFWVMAGSVARFNVSNAFESVEALVTLRRKLIDEGVLGIDPSFPDYIFTRDCYFNSASMAACIVDGNARNRPDVWRKK